LKPSVQQPFPELLAPAGSFEAFFAAMEAGADAVYLGLKEFSARAKAKNFTLGDLEAMLAYAHRRGKKIYVTLNTLVKEAELPPLAETLAALERLRVDAVILQDLAVWRLARRHFPGLELHASTQMTVHNAAGVQMLERMGFTRGVLARELSIDEIAEIRSRTTLELEHFIHGALCFSFSGQCYFSSWLGGKSGNRGRCAQPCRRQYRQRNKDGYFFSPNDLSAIDLLDELAAAGICSFKIEGRMKSAEYVYNVVSAYRMVMDAEVRHKAEKLKEAKALLKESFGRPPTRGFLPGGTPTDIAVASVKGATGQLLGEVSKLYGPAIAFQTRGALHIGDRLRVQPRSDRPGTAFTIRELQVGRKPVKKVDKGAFVSIPTPFKDVFQVGDAVFKVSSTQAFTLSEAACRKRLEQSRQEPHAVSLAVVMPDNRTLEIEAALGEQRHSFRFEVETFPAEASPLSDATLREAFSRTAGEPFVLGELSAGRLPPLVIPPSRLKQIRRELYAQLREKLEAQQQSLGREHLQQARREQQSPAPRRADGERRLTVGIGQLRDLQILSHPGVDRVLVPLSAGNVEAALHQRRAQGQAGQILWDVPMIRIGEQWRQTRELVERLVGQGFGQFRLNNLGHFPLFDGLEGVTLHGSYRLFILNSQAAHAWHELGLAGGMLYVEDDRDNLARLLQVETGLDYELTVYANIPLLTSRIPIPAVKPDAPVLSDRGQAYRVSRRGELSVVAPTSDFSLTQHAGTLEALGCRHLTADLSHLGPFTPEGKRALEAVLAGSLLEQTSDFNFDHEME